MGFVVTKVVIVTVVIVCNVTPDISIGVSLFDHIVSVCTLLPSKLKQQLPPKRRYICSKLHDVFVPKETNLPHVIGRASKLRLFTYFLTYIFTYFMEQSLS